MSKKSKPVKRRPFYRKPPPKPKGRAALPRSQAEQQLGPTNDIPHAHPLAPSHFTLREDGEISVGRDGVSPSQIKSDSQGQRHAVPPSLIFSSDNPFLRLYCGNCLELLAAIAAKYPEGRFDAIFADPPYFLSNGGIISFRRVELRET